MHLTCCSEAKAATAASPSSTLTAADGQFEAEPLRGNRG
jgi:hypothetical protein